MLQLYKALSYVCSEQIEKYDLIIFLNQVCCIYDMNDHCIWTYFYIYDKSIVYLELLLLNNRLNIILNNINDNLFLIGKVFE